MERLKTLTSRHRTNEAALFVENEMGLAQESNDHVYDDFLDQFVTKEISEEQYAISDSLWRSANKEKTRLFDLVARVQEKQNKGKGRPEKVDLRYCKWNEVMTVVSDTSHRWKTAPSYTASARRCFEKLGQASGSFEAWLGLLPAGDYGSSICGAFKLAIGAANQYSKAIDCIFEALGDIPEAMESAQRYVKIYQDNRDQNLEYRTFDLYISVLRALCKIMQFFVDDRIQKLFSAIVKQNVYQQELFRAIQDVTKHTSKVREAANQCLAARQQRMHRTVIDTHGKVDETWKLMQSQYRMLKEATVAAIRNCDQLSNNQAILTALCMRQRATKVDSEEGPSKSLKRLLKALNSQRSLEVRDQSLNNQTSHNLSEEEKSRAAILVTHPQLRDWVYETTSCSLLINGNADLETAEGDSSLSFVDAQLVRIVSQSNTFVLSYFCTLESGNELGAIGILASFVEQLIGLMQDNEISIDLSFMGRHQWDALEQWDGLTLYIILRELVAQLPEKTVVVCVLDELTFYETSELGEETDCFMRRLKRLVNIPEDVIFKLLVTCRGRALDFQRYFDDEEVLNLEGEIEMGDTARWTIDNFGGIFSTKTLLNGGPQDAC